MYDFHQIYWKIHHWCHIKIKAWDPKPAKNRTSPLMRPTSLVYLQLAWSFDILTGSKHIANQDSILLAVLHHDFCSARPPARVNLVQICRFTMLLSHEIMRNLYTSNIHFIENIEKIAFVLPIVFCSKLLHRVNIKGRTQVQWWQPN